MFPLVAVLFAFALLVMVLTVSVDSIGAIHLVLSYLLLAVVAFNVYDHREHHGISPLCSLQVALTFALGTALLTLVVGGLGLRRLELAIVFGVVLTFVLTRDDLKTILPTSYPYLAAFTILFGIFLYHAREFASGSGMGLFPILAGVVLALNLFVLPRYVSEETVYWSIAGLAATVAATGLPAIVYGEFTWWLFEIRTWGGDGRPIIRSIFANPNTFGLLMFPGVVASVVATHRTLTRSSSRVLASVPLGFLALTVLGLYLSNSRASILAAAIAIAIYLLITATDYRTVPVALLAIGITVPLFLLGISLSVLPIDPSNRFTLWRAGFEAVRADSDLLGQGIVSTAEAIEPYLDGGGNVHNSYLSMFIRAGLLGGLAYLVIVIGPLVHGLLRPDRMNVGMFALATGFAIHQLFEGYALYGFGPGSVIGALALGYVIYGLATAPERPTETTAETKTETETNATIGVTGSGLWPDPEPFEQLYASRERNADSREE